MISAEFEGIPSNPLAMFIGKGMSTDMECRDRNAGGFRYSILDVGSKDYRLAILFYTRYYPKQHLTVPKVLRDSGVALAFCEVFVR